MKEITDKPEAVVLKSGADRRIGVKWYHWAIGVSLVILLTVLMPRGKSPEFAHLTLGSISPRKIIAPFDFWILKSDEVLKKERCDAAENVLPVLTTVDTVKVSYNRELLNFASESHKVLSGFPESFFETIRSSGDSLISRRGRIKGARNLSLEDSVILSRGSEKLFNSCGFRLADDTWRFLIRLFDQDRSSRQSKYFNFFEKSLGAILLDVYDQGVINVPKDQLKHASGSVMVQQAGEEIAVELNHLLTPPEAMRHISTLLSDWLSGDSYPQGSVSAACEIVQPFVAANVIYNGSETDHRREAAIAKVPIAKGFVKKDELIIGANIRVTREHLDKLNSLALERAELEMEQDRLGFFMQIGGQFLLVAMIILLFWVFIALVRPETWRQWKLMLLVGLVIGLIHLFQALVPVKYDLSRFIFPAAVGVLLLAILVDRGVALAGVIVLALIAGLIRGNDFSVAFSALVVGGVALYAVKKVQTRTDVMRVSFYLTGIYIPLVAAFHFVRFTSGEPLLNDLAVAVGNGVLSPMLVLGLVIICENLFGITTDLSLLELVDLNRPLLRELALKSPGTYHHSIMVGSLAETAAREIGANTLLTRAGAYYHDIGKMVNKEYFIENQEAGSRNIHDSLPPAKSAEMVISHVRQGLELAEKYRLPPQIRTFISEHHGLSRLAFFYAKAKDEKGGDVDESLFHYPGPKPESRETGILMLADTVEAAIRSMDDHSPAELTETVDNLIRVRLSEGELDECPLTLREIGKIRDAFVQVLSGIYHQRIPYPGQESKTETIPEEGEDS